ncbi:MAG: hypothetical protein AAFY26_04405 [Cyanobacteria bacterium J06638_22]|jgi:hypothetical protein
MTCLCCSEPMLRHIGTDGVYWYCLSCRQAIPNLKRGRLPNSASDRPLSISRVILSAKEDAREEARQVYPRLWSMTTLQPSYAS